MFNTYTSSKYDTTIILICLCVFIFIFAIISCEIERSENKYKDAIITVLLIIGVLGFSALASRFMSFEYLFDLLIILAGIFVLSGDTITFYKKKKYKTGIIKEIRIKNSRTLGSIYFIIFILFQAAVHTRKLELIDLFVISALLIDMPMDYLVNSYLDFYEGGISLVTFSFPKKFLHYNEIIPYEKIENLTFIEYKKRQFILKIQAEKSIRKSSYRYKMNAEAKEEMILFMSNFIDKENNISNI